MKIDYLASIGHFAFRYVPHSDAPGIVALMDEENIDLALVSSLESVMFRNVQKGNELLAERIDKHKERLIGAAVISPAYPEAVEDALYCIENLGMKALRFYPNYHGYELTDSRVASVVSVAQKKNVPVSIAFRVEDERQRHWLIETKSIPPQAVMSLMKAFPDVDFVMERASYGELSALIANGPETENWYAETSGRFLLGSPNRGLREIVDAIGPGRLLFGTDMPLQYPQPAILKLASLGLDKKSLSKVTADNAARLLKL